MKMARDQDSTMANTGGAGRWARADAHVTEAAPVHLGLLGRLELDAQVGLARHGRAHLGHVPPQLRDGQRGSLGRATPASAGPPSTRATR